MRYADYKMDIPPGPEFFRNRRAYSRGPKPDPDSNGRVVEHYNGVNQEIKYGILAAYYAWIRNDLKESMRELDKIFLSLQDGNGTMFRGMVHDTLNDNERADEFLVFVQRNMPHNLRASMPEPSHASICALLESLHNRLATLEASVAFKTNKHVFIK